MLLTLSLNGMQILSVIVNLVNNVHLSAVIAIKAPTNSVFLLRWAEDVLGRLIHLLFLADALAHVLAYRPAQDVKTRRLGSSASPR